MCYDPVLWMILVPPHLWLETRHLWLETRLSHDSFMRQHRACHSNGIHLQGFSFSQLHLKRVTSSYMLLIFIPLLCYSALRLIYIAHNLYLRLTTHTLNYLNKSTTMLLKTAALVLLSSFTATRADNTPNLCSGDIPNLQRIKPSTTGVTNIPGTFRINVYLLNLRNSN